MRAGIAGAADDWAGLGTLVERRNRDRDADKVLVGEDGKCAGNVAEVGETEWRAKEGFSTEPVIGCSHTLYRPVTPHHHTSSDTPQI